MKKTYILAAVILCILLFAVAGIGYYQSQKCVTVSIYFDYSDYSYAELSNKSDVVLSGVVIDVGEPVLAQTGLKGNIFYQDYISDGNAYTDLTVLVNECYQGGDNISDFVTVRIFDNHFYNEEYKWGDNFVFFLIEDPGITKKIGPDHYLIMTPMGQINRQSDPWVNALDEPVTFEELYQSLPNGMLEVRPYEQLVRYDRMNPTAYGLNPNNEIIRQFLSGGISNVPESGLLAVSKISFVPKPVAANNSDGFDGIISCGPVIPPYTAASHVASGLITNSDLVFYGVVKEEASNVSMTEKTDFDALLKSNVVFTIEDSVKGQESGDVNVSVYAGNYNGKDLSFTNDLQTPTAWDFKTGDRYLLYLIDKNGTYEIMYGGSYLLK
ncbi:hypothetical protein MsAg5_12540 [Methanosarcinaceae archaeon Ag5]|uniref:Uncharacterized protein n=1 Tax=Methanolapillus africanus TaxID=3028297 RepID=A0AAE4SE93_9EURY|nr:hypothetical protein [Methanosarcinaceae archaeon Ag5]